jgi:amphi-Trp domain-containing protein
VQLAAGAIRRRVDREADVELFEFETEERLKREEAAAQLRQLADQLERHNEVAVRREGMTIRVKVPDEVTLKFEVEVEDDGSEIEIELKW